MHAVPGNPFSREGKTSEAVEEKLNERFHLDQPATVQYLYYLKGLTEFDLGPSIKFENYDVTDLIGKGFPVSARLGLLATAVMVIFSIPIGIAAAVNRGKISDKILLALTTFGIGVPSFVMASLLIRIFAIELEILPVYGVDEWKGYVLPAAALSVGAIANLTRRVRTSVSTVLCMDYIVTARAKGAGRFRILFIHALRNSLIPIVTVLGPTIASLVTGTFVIEKIFAIPGMGRYFVEAINNRDYTMIMGITIFYAIILNGMMLVVDILYSLIDPRIRYE